jgi:ATP synthase protein I
MPDDLDDLGRKIEEARRALPSEKPKSAPPSSALGIALRMSTELVAAVVVGLVLGLGFDAAFSTRPFGLLLFLGLGIAAGFYNVFRLSKQIDAATKAEKKD